MSNPTLGAGSQFNAPFNILPDSNLISLNDTTVSITQFNAPFNILPDNIFNNPTLPYTSQMMPQNPGSNIGPGGQIQMAVGLATPITSYYNPTVDPNTLGLNSQFISSNNGSSPGYTGNPTLNQKPIPEYISAPINVTGSFTNLNNAKFLRNGFGYASSIAAGTSGFPQIGQSAQKVFDSATNQSSVINSTYFTLPFDQLTSKLNFSGDTIDIVNSIGSLAPYNDFRAKRFASSFANQNASLAVKISSAIGRAKMDGASAALRPGNFSPRAGIYAATSLSPAGAYSVFNLNGVGKLGYGWGDHDSKFALRNDFTLRSEVATRWSREGLEKFVRTRNPIEFVTPFRGDKVTVIDFGKRLLKNAYQWKPSKDRVEELNVPKTSLTKDFIKFFLTGPSLTANNLFGDRTGGITEYKDDIIVFRAILTSLSDSFGSQWTDVKMIGRADPNYHYGGYTRDLSVGFDIVITDRDEIKPTWRKLNALAGYCAPIYDGKSIALTAPWMRITLGDLFHQTPVALSSLSYTYDLDHSWEINIEDDKEMFETPRKISVSCDFKVIADAIPQNGGRFFGLAREYDKDNNPIKNNNNWLSDFKDNVDSRAFGQGETTN